jgi:trehalose 6-phosphate synthase
MAALSMNLTGPELTMPVNLRRVAPAKPRPRLVVVSNRVSSPSAEKGSPGGLAVALLAALQAQGGIWFGWSGNIAEHGIAPPKIRETAGITFATVDLAQRDYDEYYAGHANRVLWPLCHFRPDLVEFNRPDLEGYRRVNAGFARQLQPLLQPEDLVWVHDYHLVPLGAELRRQGARQKLGFFLHIPFPGPELLRVLPNHRELVEQLSAYDLLGFQTETDVDAFRDYVLRVAGGRAIGRHRLSAFGREFTARAFPIGIDVEAVAERGAASTRSRQTARLGDSLIGHDLIVGVDRLDYSKGLVRRFDAFSRLLERHQELCGKVTFLQIAPASRSDVPEYAEIRRSLEEASGRINGAYAEPDWTPLRYLNRSFTHRALMGFFRFSSVGFVTPLRDGMNLVAKEYVAAQNGNDPGVLILSGFAGAARELTSALIVNPYDLDDMAEALHQALVMPVGERRERWNDMMTILRRNDIHAWREDFLERLALAGSAAAAAP